MSSRFTPACLFVSGLVGVIVGAASLFAPAAFHATSGIVLGNDVNLLNEIRASGGGVLAAALVVLAGAVRAGLRHTGLVVAVLVYLGYGAARVVSLGLDGWPHATLVLVMVLELLIGLVGLVLLWRGQA